MSYQQEMQEYLDIFLQEAEEQVEVLEDEMLQLEAHPTLERIQTIFRSAHTLKGNSRAMGFDHFSNLTHEMENVFQQMRESKCKISSELINEILNSIDLLKKMLINISQKKGDQLDSKKQVDNLVRLINIATPKTIFSNIENSLTQEQIQILRKNSQQDGIYIIKLELSSNCQMPYVRVLLIKKIIEEESNILFSIPNQQELENESFDKAFEFYVQCHSSIKKVNSQLKNVNELESFQIVKWKDSYENISKKPNSPKLETQKEKWSKIEQVQTVRVDVERLDSILDLISELIIDRTHITEIGKSLAQLYPNNQINDLNEVVRHVSKITTDLKDHVMKTRMLPIEKVYHKIPRVVRDLTYSLKKKAILEMKGGQTELDRSIIEAISDPILHIIRNCLDHGLEGPEERIKLNKPEQGLISIYTKHNNGFAIIEIKDDGKGIDIDNIKQIAVDKGLIDLKQSQQMSEKEALHLICNNGFSTAKNISDISGRGVGMDIVGSNIKTLGGFLEIDSTLGCGTCFTLCLPLTMAIIKGLLVKINAQNYLMPLNSIFEAFILNPLNVQIHDGREMILLRDQSIPLINLRKTFPCFNLEFDLTQQKSYVLVSSFKNHRIGFLVDELIGEQDVVIKRLNRFCGDISGINGATILADGTVSLIIDIQAIISKELNGYV